MVKTSTNSYNVLDLLLGFIRLLGHSAHQSQCVELQNRNPILEKCKGVTVILSSCLQVLRVYTQLSLLSLFLKPCVKKVSAYCSVAHWQGNSNLSNNLIFLGKTWKQLSMSVGVTDKPFHQHEIQWSTGPTHPSAWSSGVIPFLLHLSCLGRMTSVWHKLSSELHNNAALTRYVNAHHFIVISLLVRTFLKP